MRRMLEFTRIDDAPDGRHRMRTGGGSVLSFAANGATPPARLVVMYGAHSPRAVPVQVLSTYADGAVEQVALPGGAGGRIAFSPLDAPVEGPAAVVLIPIASLPSPTTVPIGAVDEEPVRAA